jgi:5-hydroxyisourate hydrolase-like protein (transthyretin family)
MNSFSRYLVALAVSCSCAGLPSEARGQTKATTKTVASSVSGRITIHGKGAPGITVGIRRQEFSSQSLPAAKAITDQDGNYRITGILPGSVQVAPIAPVYVSPDAMSGGKRLLLAEGEDVQGIDFVLERGGVITGKVTDADGRPVIEERITISPEGQSRSRGQQPPFVGGQRFQTDDRGIYRIYGIPEGRYKVSAGRADDDSSPDNRPGRIVYKRTFYPDTTDPDSARIVEVTGGAELSNIDIALGRNLPSFSASGKVVDGETGQPIVGLKFMLQRIVGNNYSMLQSMSTSNSQGEFRIDNVTPGKYLVVEVTQLGSEVRAEGAPFEVTDQDVTGLLVKTFKGSSITGTIVIEGITDKNILNKVADLHLEAYSHTEGSKYSGREAVLSSDGTFRIGGLMPGTLGFSLGTRNFRSPPETFSILRIERAGIVQPRNLTIKAGENLTDITIILSYGTGAIRGSVKTENGSLPQGAQFGIWIKKLGETGDSNSYPRTYSDVRGHFLIERLAAGTYELSVNVNIPGGRPVPPVKRVVTVSEAATVEVEVTLDLKSNTEQLPQP